MVATHKGGILYILSPFTHREYHHVMEPKVLLERLDLRMYVHLCVRGPGLSEGSKSGRSNPSPFTILSYLCSPYRFESTCEAYATSAWGAGACVSAHECTRKYHGVKVAESL